MIKDIIYNINDENFNINRYLLISNKSAKINCVNGKCFFIKGTDYYTDEKYKLLYNEGVNNILYPKVNEKGNFVNKKRINNEELLYYISDYYKDDVMSIEYKAKHLIDELTNLHLHTRFKKELTKEKSRKKLEDIYQYLQYKFNLLESFVRSVECSPFDENSILILKNYHYLLDCKNIMAKLNKKIIYDVKNNKSIYHSFIHNNPKIDHLIVNNGKCYLISLEKSKIGIPSLDIVKYYMECESYNIDIKLIILNYFENYDDEFYLNYFYFFVLLFYIKGIIIYNNNYITSQSFVYGALKIKKFIEKFELLSV